MTLNKALKVGAYTIAGALLCGALTYYNFVDKVDASGGAVLYEECPDFSITKYEKKHGSLAVSEEKFVMSEHRGKVVVLNFWATWCEPCKKEIPDFAKIARVFAVSAESQSQGSCSQYPSDGWSVGYSSVHSAAMRPSSASKVALDAPPPKSIPSKYFIAYLLAIQSCSGSLLRLKPW